MFNNNNNINNDNNNYLATTSMRMGGFAELAEARKEKKYTQLVLPLCPIIGLWNHGTHQH